MTVPPVDAVASDTVQLETPLECREVGLQTSEILLAVPLSVRLAVFEAPLKLAVTVAVCVDETVPALAVKLAEVAPCGTVMEAGTVSKELPEESATAAPPAGAAAVRVTVQVEDAPEASVAGAHCTDAIAATGITVKTAVCVAPA